MNNGRLPLGMNQLLVIKASRLLLALSVSVWMAGGCLFGCGGSEVMAAEVVPATTVSSAAVSGESCDKSRQHDCCTRPNGQKSKTKTSRRIARRLDQATGSSVLANLPHSMKDCPLMTNATAVTARSSGNLPDPGHTSVTVLPTIKGTAEETRATVAPDYLPNRGPTHLRCCVFLI